jgi:hypothetical protein
MPPALKRTAALVIRVWFEEEMDEAALRARITRTLDVSRPGGSESCAATSEQEVVKTVRAWLRELSAGR